MYFQELKYVFESTRMCHVCILLRIRVLADFIFLMIVHLEGNINHFLEFPGNSRTLVHVYHY